jgi:hypothetical protein
LIHKSCLANCTSQGQISLFEVLNVELQSIKASLGVDNLVHRMEDSLGGNVILAPDSSRHGSDFSVNVNDIELLAARTFHRHDIEA